MIDLHHGDCLDIMPTLEANSVDSIVTDPPYGLSFMGKDWDHGVPGEAFWVEALRVAKPGAYLLAFGGTRMVHRLAVAIEDAGWEIRDRIHWCYGSGFPKSHNVSKAIDKAAGAEPIATGKFKRASIQRNGAGDSWDAGAFASHPEETKRVPVTTPATPEAQQWSGWGTALKPAVEPIIMARKPLSEKTVAANVLEHGTGAINVDGCRVGTEKWTRKGGDGSTPYGNDRTWSTSGTPDIDRTSTGRWPANLIHDGSDEVVGLFPNCKQAKDVSEFKQLESMRFSAGGQGAKPQKQTNGKIITASAARFFKCCPPDATCPLCCLPYAEACDTLEAWKNILAQTAKKNGWTSQATNEFIARANAIGSQNEKLVQNVRSVGSLCSSCATSIAVALVGIKTSAFSNEELQAILASTGSCNASILIQSLASFAELGENTGTTLTTTSLSILFGSVRDAIENYTKQESPAKAAGGSDPEKETAYRLKYSPKASKRDRDEGCEGLEERATREYRTGNVHNMHGGRVPDKVSRNHHPTVKPTDLMRYLCRLVTQPGGVVLDPFMGSGSTGKAARLEGFNFIGIEKDAEYFAIASKRINAARGLFNTHPHA